MEQTNLGLDPQPKKTRKEVFLDQMNQVVPSGALVAIIQPHAQGAGHGEEVGPGAEEGRTVHGQTPRG